MSFQFKTQEDADKYSSLNRLIKFNNGFFKSAKQSKLFNERMTTECSWFSNLGIDIADKKIIHVCAYVRWVDYGIKSFRDVDWIFLIDEFGIVSQYKIGFSAGAPDPKKIQLLFSRDTSIPVPVFEEPQPQKTAESISEWFGNVGDRVTFDVEVVSVKKFESSTTYSYYDSGVRYITTTKNGNDLVKYWGHINTKDYDTVNVGDKFKVKATIKSHDEYKGIKSTTISRPVFEKIKEEENQDNEIA